jgi:hypothetical protein
MSIISKININKIFRMWVDLYSYSWYNKVSGVWARENKMVRQFDIDFLVSFVLRLKSNVAQKYY